MKIDVANLSTVSTRPTTAVQAMAQNWAVGELLNVRVVARIDEETLRVTINNQEATARTALPLPAGAQFSARVAVAGEMPQLSLQAPPPAESESAPVNVALGRSLPQQAPLSEVMPRLMAALPETTGNPLPPAQAGQTPPLPPPATATPGAATTSTPLPAAVQATLQTLASTLPTLTALTRPDTLAAMMSQTGTQLEPHLERLMTQATGTTPGNPLPAGAAGTVPPNALPAQDLKWQLLNLRESLLQSLQTLASARGATIAESDALKRPTVGSTTPMTNPQTTTAGGGAQPGSEELRLGGLLREVEAGLARITTHQLNTTRAADNQHLLAMFELPVKLQQQTGAVSIEVDADQRQATGSASRPLRVLVEVPVEGMGTLRARLSLNGSQISVAAWADTPELRTLVAGRLNELDQSLLAQGFSAARSVMQNVPAPEPVRPSGTTRLIDTQA